LKKFATLAKKAAELVKCATLGKMLNVWQNAPHLKNAPNMEKWATLRKVPPIKKKCGTVGKMK